MGGKCLLCGAPVEEGKTLCKRCEEEVRAEALGKKKRVTQEAQKELKRLGWKGESGGPLPRGQEEIEGEEAEKKPRDFRSMAEYLEYLKGKR